MARKAVIKRQIEREKLVKKHAARRKALRKIINDPNASLEEKEKANAAFAKLPKDSSAVRLRNRCPITGRGRGFYRVVGLCRHVFRWAVMNGMVPGIKKSSW